MNIIICMHVCVFVYTYAHVFLYDAYIGERQGQKVVVAGVGGEGRREKVPRTKSADLRCFASKKTQRKGEYVLFTDKHL